MRENVPVEIYIHVPFCVKKCAYCDFYSFSADEAVKRQYFSDLISEIEASPYTGRPVRSIFIGGGTPSSADPKLIEKTLEEIRRQFCVLPNAEITIEANPGTVTEESLRIYRNAGIDRLSLGLQSANEKTLRKLGRIHTFPDFERSFLLARKCGFDNISVDLMSALPGETLSDFENSLFQVLSYRPEHISVYSLIIEENTPFYALYNAENGTMKQELPDEEEDRKMTAAANRILASAGYQHYEISNYARPGYGSVHNTGYWTGVPYLGFGPAAASCIDGLRFKNPLSLTWYDEPYIETEELSSEDLENEFMILGLRMMKGVDDREFRRRFGTSFFDRYREVIEKYIMLGALEREGEILRLTPYGIDVSNIVFAELI
ncbi:MAG: radical SAM family heme chaperone HemW [Lachnospiraceae bacterium]|nr:radical SAM family heme chaperone HemW [Lachnospiraceae bacterium]